MGFTERPKIDAIAIVVSLPGRYRPRVNVVLVMTLDVRNAFNGTNWGWIKGTLAKLGLISSDQVEGLSPLAVQKFLGESVNRMSV